MTKQILLRIVPQRNRSLAGWTCPIAGMSLAGRTTIVALVALWGCSSFVSLMSCVHAEELLVDNVRGSDAQLRDSSLEMRSPFRTLQRAIDSARIGDTINVKNTGEPYREMVSLSNNRTLANARFPLVIEGNGAVFDGTQPLGFNDWEPLGRDLFELKVDSPGYVKLFSSQSDLTLLHVGLITDLSVLKPLEYGRHLGKVYFRTKPGDIPQNYSLSVTKLQTGLTVYDIAYIELRNFTFRGYRLDGVNCHDLAEGITFENFTFTDNARSGLSVGGASMVTLLNSVSKGNGESQVRTEGQGLLELQNVTIEPGDALEFDRSGGRIVTVKVP